MKKLILCLAILCFSFLSYAQETSSDNKLIQPIENVIKAENIKNCSIWTTQSISLENKQEFEIVGDFIKVIDENRKGEKEIKYYNLNHLFSFSTKDETIFFTFYAR